MLTPVDREVINDSASAADLTAEKVADRKAAAGLFLVVTFLLVFIMAARTPLDTDLWWHLRSGEETLRTGQPLLSDPFSFTRLGAHWINHSWLSQVGMALLFRWGGFLALGAAVALLAVLSVILIYRQCEGPMPLKAAAILLGSVVASPVWSTRPQLVSLVMFALVGYLLYLYKWRRKDYLWWLLPIFILWSNLHGGYVLGLLLIGSMLAGEGLNHLVGNVDQRLPWKAILRLGIIGLLCGFAVLVNPNGLDTWRIPFQTINVGALQQFIPEWASPDFHEPVQQSLLWLLLLTVALVALSGKRVDGSDLVPFLGFAFMALLARRNYGPFALCAVPVLVRYGGCVIQNMRVNAAWLQQINRKKKTPKSDSRAVKAAINLIFVALLGLVALGKLYGVTHPALVNFYMEQNYPVKAAAWLAENRPGARLFNEYDWGGYLIWKLPGTPVFVDGRTDLFGDTVIGDWIDIIQASEGWSMRMAEYPVDLVVISRERPLNEQLVQAGWQMLYQDTQSAIYGHP